MSLLLNGRRMPEPMVKSEDDEIIIDLECTELPLPKGPLLSWHKQVITLLKKCYMNMSDTSFEDLLKFYRRSLPEQINCLNNETLIKDKILLHLSHINILYQESQTCYVYIPNYFDYLVDILTEYVNLEMVIIKHLRKRDMNRQGYVMLTKITALKICKVLSIYLKHNEEHIMHTLLKLRYEKKSVPCRDVLNKVYLHFLIHQPVENPSDRAFCRNYLVLQNWKGILNGNQHEIMDKMLIEKFRQDADYLNRNETLKIIRTTKPKSTSSLFNQIMNRKSYDEEAYFDYIKKTKEHDDIPSISVAVNYISIDDDNSSKENWESSYLLKNIMNNTSNRGTFKDVLFEEEDNRCKPNNIFDDDLITETEKNVPGSSSELPSLICLIDDDSDIEEIVYFANNKEANTNIREEEPIICIDLDEENSNDCIAIEETPVLTTNNNSNVVSIEDITISDSRDCTTIQQGASSEKDSGFEETPNADVAENTQIPDSEIVRNDEVSTDKIIESVGVVTSDEIAATKKLDSSDDCCHEKINSIEHFDIEEVDDRMVISKIEIESMQIVNDSTKDKIESINKEIQIDSGNNLIASEQNVDCQMSLTNDKETESPERDRDNGEEPKMDDDFSKKPVSPESPQSCVETASNNSDGMETNNIDQKRNCMDSETQTDPNTTTPFSSIYDTPPSEQFEAKSPEMANNKYLTINSDAITNCVQEDLNCQIQRSTSESDKENFSDMENVENSDLDNEHSDVNDLLKNISDENSKGDYETTDYATSPLDHGNGDSVNDETIRTDEMMEVDEQPEEVIANEHSTEENIDEHPQEMVINELPEEKVVDEYSEEEVVDEHPEEEVGDEHPEKEIVHEYPQEVVVDKYPEEEVVHEHLEEVVVDKHQEEVVVNEQEEEELLEEHAEGVIVNEHPEELVVNEQQEEDLLNEHLEESNPEPQLKIIIESVETISDETFSAIEKNEGYLNGEKMDEEEVYNEESVIVEATSEISAIQNDCAYSNEYNYVTTTSINTVQETSQTEQKPVVVKPQENNNVNSVSLNNFKSVNSETVKVNGIKILDNRKVVLPEIFKKEELTPKKSALKVMYTSPQVIKGDFTEFERLYCEYNDKCVSDTFKDALSGPVTKLNGMPVSDNDFNILDAVQQSLLNNLTIKTQSINGNSNTDTSSSSQPSSPNITCDMDFADLRTDFESYMNKEMRAFQDGNPGASHKPLKAQKRVAISENDNKIHHDNRTAEELKFIYSKRVRYDTKVNGESSYMARHRRKESNYIRRMRKKDEKLQMEPQVHVDLFTEDELWQKLEREIEERERERLERAVYYRKHNTTESRILFRLFPSKENRVEETQTTLENYSNTGTDRNSKTMLHQNTNLGVEVKSRKRNVKLKNLSPVYTTTKRKRGRPPKNQQSTDDISKEFDKLKTTPSYVDCSYKGSSKVHT